MSGLRDVVLLVEDNPDDVFLIQRAFARANIRTPLEVVGDGDQAVAFLSRCDGGAHGSVFPVLVLLDLKLPRKSGLEVLEWIKRCAGLRRVPVVVLTSSRAAEDVGRAYDLGANSYLAKPVRPDALLGMVEQINAYWLSLNERSALVQSGS